MLSKPPGEVAVDCSGTDLYVCVSQFVEDAHVFHRDTGGYHVPMPAQHRTHVPSQTPIPRHSASGSHAAFWPAQLPSLIRVAQDSSLSARAAISYAGVICPAHAKSGVL